jgi:hypothetical protein
MVVVNRFNSKYTGYPKIVKVDDLVIEQLCINLARSFGIDYEA